MAPPWQGFIHLWYKACAFHLLLGCSQCSVWMFLIPPPLRPSTAVPLIPLLPLDSLQPGLRFLSISSAPPLSPSISLWARVCVCVCWCLLASVVVVYFPSHLHLQLIVCVCVIHLYFLCCSLPVGLCTD